METSNTEPKKKQFFAIVNPTYEWIKGIQNTIHNSFILQATDTVDALKEARKQLKEKGIYKESRFKGVIEFN